MSAGDIDKVVLAALVLSPAELKTAILKLQALSAVSSGKKKNESESLPVQTLYHAISRHLYTQLHVRPVAINIFFTRTHAAQRVKESLTSAVAQLEQLAPRMTPVEWASISDLIADLAVTRIRQRNFNPPWLGITYTLQNLPSLLDEHFPGYASNGLLGVVLKLRTKNEGRLRVRD